MVYWLTWSSPGRVTSILRWIIIVVVSAGTRNTSTGRNKMLLDKKVGVQRVNGWKSNESLPSSLVLLFYIYSYELHRFCFAHLRLRIIKVLLVDVRRETSLVKLFADGEEIQDKLSNGDKRRSFEDMSLFFIRALHSIFANGTPFLFLFMYHPTPMYLLLFWDTCLARIPINTPRRRRVSSPSVIMWPTDESNFSHLLSLSLFRFDLEYVRRDSSTNTVDVITTKRSLNLMLDSVSSLFRRCLNP